MTYVLQLGLIGICIALLPLSYVWVKADDNKFRKLVWLTTFLTLDLARNCARDGSQGARSGNLSGELSEAAEPARQGVVRYR